MSEATAMAERRSGGSPSGGSPSRSGRSCARCARRAGRCSPTLVLIIGIGILACVVFETRWPHLSPADRQHFHPLRVEPRRGQLRPARDRRARAFW